MRTRATEEEPCAVFLRLLKSHTAGLDRARESNEPAGQIAACELEVGRIEIALRRNFSSKPRLAKFVEAGDDESDDPNE